MEAPTKGSASVQFVSLTFNKLQPETTPTPPWRVQFSAPNIAKIVKLCYVFLLIGVKPRLGVTIRIRRRKWEMSGLEPSGAEPEMGKNFLFESAVTP